MHRLGPAECWLLGDDRSRSCDSWRWGAVRRSAIIGHLAAIYWPLSQIQVE